MLEHRLNKQDFSESVVRQSLYWMSRITPWQLSENEHEWIVQFSVDNEDILCEFQRLLNDYLLRENLSAHTQRLREQIASAVLSSVERQLRL